MNLSEHDRMRLTRAWQPGVWIGGARRAFGPVADLPEVGDDQSPGVIENRPAQWLIALWGPQSLDRPFLARLPLVVQLTSRQDAEAVLELLRHVPDDRRLWLAAQVDVDWTLMAEIVQLTEPALQPWQQRELTRFILAEREAQARFVIRAYLGREHDEGYTPTVPGDLA